MRGGISYGSGAIGIHTAKFLTKNNLVKKSSKLEDKMLKFTIELFKDREPYFTGSLWYGNEVVKWLKKNKLIKT